MRLRIFGKVFGTFRGKSKRERSLPKVRDISNVRVGRLVALRQSGKDNQGRAKWLCACDCGVQKEIPSRHLVNGAVKSCGCLSREVSADNGRRGSAKLRGSSSHLYNPRLTEADRLTRRNLPELRIWRKSVFDRDGYTCDLCKCSGGKLNAHHLNCWAEYPEDRYDVENGVTLCSVHHKEFHTHMGGERKPCCADDYRNFKAVWYIEREIERREKEKGA